MDGSESESARLNSTEDASESLVKRGSEDRRLRPLPVLFTIIWFDFQYQLPYLIFRCHVSYQFNLIKLTQKHWYIENRQTVIPRYTDLHSYYTCGKNRVYAKILAGLIYEICFAYFEHHIFQRIYKVIEKLSTEVMCTNVSVDKLLYIEIFVHWKIVHK